MKNFNGIEVDISDTTFVYVETIRLVLNRLFVMWGLTLIVWGLVVWNSK